MTRRKNDFYPTQKAATIVLLNSARFLVRKSPDAEAPLIYEPCAGEGDISKVLREAGANVFESDIAPTSERVLLEDARTKVYAPGSKVITNPPFNQSLPIVKNAVDQGLECAFLLRLTFLEPTNGRGQFLADNPPTGLIVLPRISFTGDGRCDSVTCAWMIWSDRPQFHFSVSKELYKKWGATLL